MMLRALDFCRAFCILFAFSQICSVLSYKTAHVEEVCGTDNIAVINMGSSNANSSGILRVSKNRTFVSNLNCTIILQPPLGFGVVLSIRRLDFRPYYSSDCKNYVKIFDTEKTITLCGYSDDVTEYQSYASTGDPLKLQFYTQNKTGSEFHSETAFVFTSYLRSNIMCDEKLFLCANQRCIWKGLMCDGHNNCGDQSDEDVHKCGALAAGIIAAIMVGILLFVLLIGSVVAVMCRVRRRRRERRLNSPPLIDTTSGTNYDSMPTGNIQDYTSEVNAGSSDPSIMGADGGRTRVNSKPENGYHDRPPAYSP